MFAGGRDAQGVTSGLMTTFRNLGGTAGVAVLGGVYQAQENLVRPHLGGIAAVTAASRSVFLIGAALAAAALLAALAIKPSPPDQRVSATRRGRAGAEGAETEAVPT
jgi:hypothetical protein